MAATESRYRGGAAGDGHRLGEETLRRVPTRIPHEPARADASPAGLRAKILAALVRAAARGRAGRRHHDRLHARLRDRRRGPSGDAHHGGDLRGLGRRDRRYAGAAGLCAGRGRRLAEKLPVGAVDLRYIVSAGRREQPLRLAGLAVDTNSVTRRRSFL